jgi:regulatory protein
MIISAIKAQVKNPNRVSVFVDGKYTFSLSLDELLETKLKNGQELASPELKNLQQLSSDGKLRMRAFEWLMIRPRSARELKDYLRKKQAGDELVQRIMSDAQKRNYQNDMAFAKWWVEQRRSGKQRSARYITQELASKGVPREIISDVLAENETSDIDTLRILVVKKRRSARYTDDQTLIEYLARQGYSFSLIKEVLAE